MKTLLLLSMLGAAVLGACGGSAIPEPRAADAQRGTLQFSDVTLVELEHGRSLYLSRCGSCHVLKRPNELSSERWQAEVDEMRTKNGVKLSDGEAQAIVRYLVLASSQG